MSKEYKEYRWKWGNYPRLKLLDRVPIHLDIEITTRCNLKCVMCERTITPPKLLDLPMKTYKKIIDEFAEKGGASIKLCYLGEPLLYPHLIPAIKYAKKRGIIDIMFATNGNLLNKTVASKLIKSGLTLIIFSIDSSKPEIYQKIRINGDLNKVIDGLKHLNNLKKKYKSKSPMIQIQAIPMDLNINEIESGTYKEFWKPYADVLRISPYCEDFVNCGILETPTDFFCESVYQRMTIRADGKIVVCCGTRKDNKILGDLSENTLEDVWRGKDFEQIRTLMNEQKSHLIDVCKSCSFRISRAKKK